MNFTELFIGMKHDVGKSCTYTDLKLCIVSTSKLDVR